MLNQVILVGRIQEMKREGKELFVSLLIHKSVEEEDVILVSCVLKNELANNVEKISKKGDLMGVKGFVDVRDSMIISAEKITLLSSNQEKED